MPIQRRKSRQMALQILYQNEFHKAPEKSKLRSLVLNFSKKEQSTNDTDIEYNLSDEELRYCLEILTDFYKHQKNIDEKIKIYSTNWKTERMSLIDLNIMRIAALEILYYEDIPHKVSVNEALELSKIFGEKSSTSFINGILDKVLKSQSHNQKDLVLNKKS